MPGRSGPSRRPWLRRTKSLESRRRARVRRSWNACWRLVTSTQQIVEGLLVDEQARLPVPVRPFRQDVFHQLALRNHGIDTVETDGPRNRARPRRVREVADALPIDFIVVLRDLAPLLRVHELGEQPLAVLGPIARFVFHARAALPLK